MGKGRLTADRRAKQTNTRIKKSKSMAIFVFLPGLFLLFILASSPSKAGRHFLIETDDNAEAGPQESINDEDVRIEKKSCPEGKEEWKEDCNYCWWHQEGMKCMKVCTRKACPKIENCPEGKQWKEDCNLCRCHKEGIKVCTKRACVKIEEP